MKNLTAIIISCLRVDYTIDCIISLRQTYPEIKIKVGEQVKEKPNNLLKDICQKYKADYIELPWDCGVGKSRNILIKSCDTEFILVGDDDFLYDKEAKVDKMLTFMKNTDFDLVGGRILQDKKVLNYQGFIKLGTDEQGFNFVKTKALQNNEDIPMIEWMSMLRFQQVDLTFNFFVIRRQTALSCPWDEKIKVAYEHHHFFIGLQKKGKKVAYSPDPIVKHKFQNYPATEEYKSLRFRKADKEYYFNSLGIDYLVDMRGIKELKPKFDEKAKFKQDVLNWLVDNEEDNKVCVFKLNKFISEL